MLKTEEQDIHIAYATDDNYAQHVGISILSLYLHTSLSSRLKVYVICNKLSLTNKQKLLEIARRFDSNLTFIDCDELSELLPSDVNTANLSLSTYCRLFSAELLPKYINKLLYLDCDTLINEDISKLYDWDLGDALVGGIEDTMYKEMKTSIFLNEDSSYINAGVLLIDLDKWRKAHIVKEFIAFINKFNGNVPHLDQGVINGVLKNKIEILPLKYNVQAPIFAFHNYTDMLNFFSMYHYYSRDEVLDAKRNPVIIHYTSFFLERPWFKFCIHPLKDKYRNLLVLSPFDTKLQSGKTTLLQKIKDLSFKYFQPLYLKLRAR